MQSCHTAQTSVLQPSQRAGTPSGVNMLSLEEVLRQHASRKASQHKTLDADLRRLKGQHAKKQGDEALKAENYREALERYTEAIALHPDKDTLRALYSNRSLAHCKAKRYSDALYDADEASRLAPGWSKAHWRLGAALLGLRRMPEAVLAYTRAWELAKEDAEVCAKLWAVVQRLTREQLGAALLQMLRQLQEEGKLEAPRLESVSEQEMVEGYFRIIKAAHYNKPKPGVYYERYLGWLKGGGMPPAVGYVQRAHVFVEAKCFLQARADAQAGVDLVLTEMQGKAGSTQDKACMDLLCEAYRRLGDAFMAEKDHPDRDCRSAAKAFAKAADVDPECEGARDGLKLAGEQLTKEQLEQIAQEVYNEGVLGGAGLNNPAALGFVDAPRPGERVFRVEMWLAFPQAKPSDLGSRGREVLRFGLAGQCQLDPLRVSIERVLAPTAKRAALVVLVFVQVGGDVLKGDRLVQAAKDPALLLPAIGGDELASLLGPPDCQRCYADIVDITPAFAAGGGGNGAAQQGQQGEGECEDPEGKKQLVVPPRPKLDLELPYKLYKLVRGDGSLVERADKHAFCMSRVYYSAQEKPEEVWTELLDGSCRWRQTGSEVKVQALRVPQDLPAKQLQVTIEPLYIRVCNRSSGAVYLEGDLERGVVPEDCWWSHCGGSGEDSCTLYLHKMNLEVLQNHWKHHSMWWPRLFKHHGEIAWDDYEKDYSDLPAEVLRRHRVQEAIKGAERDQEHAEKTKREMLQDRDDLRKRRRQERLNELRTGTRKDWVQLHRENPHGG